MFLGKSYSKDNVEFGVRFRDAIRSCESSNEKHECFPLSARSERLGNSARIKNSHARKLVP